jgi:hypothetical protein
MSLEDMPGDGGFILLLTPGHATYSIMNVDYIFHTSVRHVPRVRKFPTKLKVGPTLLAAVLNVVQAF